MADACMPEEFYQLARPMLPMEKRIGPLGGRPPKSHHAVLKVIWFVLVTSCRWKDVPQEMGCCGETARTRLQEWERTGIWSQLHHLLLTMLNQKKHLHLETAIIDTTHVRAFGGGEATGPALLIAARKGRNSRFWSIATVYRWCFKRPLLIAAISWRFCQPLLRFQPSVAGLGDHVRTQTTCTPTPVSTANRREAFCVG